jgi:hypothetical protein
MYIWHLLSFAGLLVGVAVLLALVLILIFH